MSNALALIAQKTGCVVLTDNPGWKNSLGIRSSSSNKMYTVAQRATSGEWCCSCLGWIMSQKRGTFTCKHLDAMRPVLSAAFPTNRTQEPPANTVNTVKRIGR